MPSWTPPAPRRGGLADFTFRLLLMLALIAVGALVVARFSQADHRLKCRYGASSVWVDAKGRVHGPVRSGCR